MLSLLSRRLTDRRCRKSDRARPHRASSACGMIMRALEPRIAFDGAMAATAEQTLAEPDASATPAAAAGAQSEADGLQGPTDFADLIASLASPGVADEGLPRLPTGECFAPPDERSAIGFIDRNAANLSALLAGVSAGADIVLLDPTQDGLKQIADVLSSRSETITVYLIGTDGDGALHLGNSDLSTVALASKADQLAQIGAALEAGGEIRIFGTRPQAGTDTAAALLLLEALSGANVTIVETSGSGAAPVSASGEATAAADASPDAGSGIIAPASFPAATLRAVHQAATAAVQPAILDVETGDGRGTIGAILGLSVDASVSASGQEVGTRRQLPIRLVGSDIVEAWARPATINLPGADMATVPAPQDAFAEASTAEARATDELRASETQAATLHASILSASPLQPSAPRLITRKPLEIPLHPDAQPELAISSL